MGYRTMSDTNLDYSDVKEGLVSNWDCMLEILRVLKQIEVNTRK